MIYLAVASQKYNETDFSYYLPTESNYNFLREKFSEFEEPNIENFAEVILFSVSKDFNDRKAKRAKIESIEKINSTIKIVFEKAEEIDTTCKDVRTKLFGYQCNMGWKDIKGLYAFPLTAGQYNNIVFPSSGTIKHADKMAQLAQLKQKSDWKRSVDLFEPLSNFETSYSEIWNNAEELDKIVYALAKLTEPSDRLGKKHYYEPYFLKFSARTTELEPWNLKYQSLMAYHYYSAYINSKSKKDYDSAKPLYEKMLDTNPSDIAELYRYAKLNHIFVDANYFSPEFDYKIIGICERNYKAALAAYDNISSEESRKYEKKNIISALYNLVVLYLDYYLDYEKAFFDIKLFKRDRAAETMLNKKKYDLLGECKAYLDRLFDFVDLNLETKIESLIYVKSTKEDAINFFYRAGQIYQCFAIVYCLTGKAKEEKYQEYLNLSNQYIKKFLDLSNARKNKGIRGLPTSYIHSLKAMNSYLMGDAKQAVESLKRGKEDSLLKAAQILCLEGGKDEALGLLKTIPDKSLMYNRAKYLRDFLTDV